MHIKLITKDSEKQELMKRLSDQQVSLMFFYEEKTGENVSHVIVEESITLMHPPFDYEMLKQWLYLGNWQAISPGNKAFQTFNTFKTKNFEIEQRMKEAKVKIIIDSFHDDREWNVIEKN